MDRLAHLSQAAVDNPNDAGVWLELGGALLDLGAVAPAQHMVARARACEPASAQHWSSLGTLLLRLGDGESALEALRAATILDNEDREAATLFARTAIEHGSPEEAEDLLNRATCLGEEPVRAYLIARAKQARGQTDAALNYALEAIRRADAPVFEHVEFAARLAGKQVRYDIEERLLRFIRQIAPRHVEHMVQLSRCLERRGRTDLAVRELERISQYDLTGAEREQVGSRYLELQDVDRAREQLQRAVQARPREVSARLLFAQALQRQGALDEAIEAYRAALQVDATRPGIHALLGAALLNAGRYADATPVLIQAVSESPEDSELRAQLTRALLMSGGAETQSDREGSLSGDLSVFRIEELLEFLGIQRATGKLHLTSKGRSGIVQIVQGRLTETIYPGCSDLATTLLSRGLLRPEQVAAMSPAQRQDEPRLVRALLEAKLVDPGVLEAVAQARIEQGVMHMLGWADGRARFEPEAAHEAFSFGFEHQRILMAVMTRLDEQNK